MLDKILNNVGLSGKTEDCAVKNIGNDQIIVTNVDIFTPIHNDPIIQGKITACNATNDVFAMNVKNIISYLSFMGVPNDQPQDITEKLLTGQREFLKEFNADINGGHTTVNPWPLTGGIVVGLCNKSDLIPKQIRPDSKSGDLLLTKPLGIQAAMASYRVLIDAPELLMDFDQKMLFNAIELGTQLMITSNYSIVEAIHEHNLKNSVAAMTDVTGFGIKRHASEMVEQRKININIDTLPIIAGMDQVSDFMGYGLMEGCAAETAGPMLICIDNSKIDTEEFQRILQKYGVLSWKIGRYETGEGITRISDNIKTIQVDKY